MQENIEFAEDDQLFFICEGAAEKNILELLINNENISFKFTDEQIESAIILSSAYRKPEKFQTEYLTMDYDEKKITIFILLDKNNFNFTIKNDLYARKIRNIYYLITAPELEMLMIHGLNKYKDFQKVKSNTKPSTFVANEKKTTSGKIKSKEFIVDFFTKKADLKNCLEIHKKKAPKLTPNNFHLIDIIEE